MKSAVVSEGAASATSAATALIVPKQQLLLNNIHYHHHNDQARPIHPSSSSRRTIPQPSASTSRLSQAGTSRCMSTTSSQISVSDSTLPPLIFFSEMPIPLCNQFQSLNPLGQVGFHWKHFSAITTIGQKDASVLLFERKNNVKGPTRIGRANRLGLIDLLRYDVSQLTQLSHPRILRTLLSLNETKELIAFACEPIQCTLDQFCEQLSSPCDSETQQRRSLEKLEMKLGILQLIEGLSYLHTTAKMLHGNLTPAAVYVSRQQFWKIGGFSFSVTAKNQNQFPCFPWTKKLPLSLQPDLDFLAPEYLDSETQMVTTAADVFSLGVLIYWIYSGGRRLIDVKGNTEIYHIVLGQLDLALDLLREELGENLRQILSKVLSKDDGQRPDVQFLALIKHHDDPSVRALRQLDELGQEFDPVSKKNFLSQTLCSFLERIPENLWFQRVLVRLEEQLADQTELFSVILRPLIFILGHCESSNVHRLKPWFRRIVSQPVGDVEISLLVVENMPLIFRRLNDDVVEDKCCDLLITLLKGSDPHLKQCVVHAISNSSEFLTNLFVSKRLIPALRSSSDFFEHNIPRQIDLLVAIAHLSDQCDSQTLQCLLTAASLWLVQRILTCETTNRLNDPVVITQHLLNPLILGLSLPEFSIAHFDDVINSCRILLDIIERLRNEHNEAKKSRNDNNGSFRRLCNRRVSMSSNHLPRLLITAARPSMAGDRKMSFLSADGRLEDENEGRRESRTSFESEVSIRLGGSDISDDSARHDSTGSQSRRKSWLEGYMLLHNASLEHQHHIETITVDKRVWNGREKSHRKTSDIGPARPEHFSSQRFSPAVQAELVDAHGSKAHRPNSVTKLSNLGHNLACTLWKTFQT